MKKIIFLLLMSLPVSSSRCEPVTNPSELNSDQKAIPNQCVTKCHDPNIYKKALMWAKDNPKKLAIITGCILGPVAIIYGYFFSQQAITQAIETISYDATDMAVKVAVPAAQGIVNAGVDNLVSNPKLIAELTLLGLGYKAIFVGLPFLMTQIVNNILKVK